MIGTGAIGVPITPCLIEAGYLPLLEGRSCSVASQRSQVYLQFFQLPWLASFSFSIVSLEAPGARPLRPMLFST